MKVTSFEETCFTNCEYMEMGSFSFRGVLCVGILVGGGMERRVKKKFWKILNKETYPGGFPYST